MQALDSAENPATESAIRPMIAIIFFIHRMFFSPLSHHAGREVCPLQAAVPDLPLSEN